MWFRSAVYICQDGEGSMQKCCSLGNAPIQRVALFLISKCLGCWHHPPLSVMYSYNIANAHGLATFCFLWVVIPAIIGGFVSKRYHTVDLWRQIFDSGGNCTANYSQLITIYPLNPSCDNQKLSINKRCKLKREGCSQFWHPAKWSLLWVQYFMIPSFLAFFMKALFHTFRSESHICQVCELMYSGSLQGPVKARHL